MRASVRQDLLSKCDERWRDATLDHFAYGPSPDGAPATFKQRYFVCDTHWTPAPDGKPGPIFFYFGNEADVLLYLNNTGLMWETAPDVGALLVFAEHRYYGESKPFPSDEIRDHMRYLTTEQAMADYAGLISELELEFDPQNQAPIIGFGGSYGGMLASWFRMKYPHLVDGVIAGSAPIWSFMGERPAVDGGYFAKGVTFDASESGGSAAPCKDNVRAFWGVLRDLASSSGGRATIAEEMRFCEAAEMSGEDDWVGVRDWVAGAWDTMAMGNFPYPSGYVINGMGTLPAFPVRAACENLRWGDMTDRELLRGMADAAGVFYNHSGDEACFDWRADVNPETSEVLDFWGYQYCTEMFQIFSKDGVTDMYWEDAWDPAAVSAGCEEAWGVTPRPMWATQEWGGRDLRACSNIVLSNGLLDPWHGGGVLLDVNIEHSVVSLIIPEGAHHLDLMFTHELDPLSVKQVRMQEIEYIQQWIDEVRGDHKAPSAAAAAAPRSKEGAVLTGRVSTAPGSFKERQRVWAS
ncbi:hypothetical protein FOA52_011048 [Chlamydomonas sp. UWO 241]|nr:hypothetical protein FOA52_011048 [Chlamydomonas sp. UWO 241]